jgi:hypothetical protein
VEVGWVEGLLEGDRALPASAVSPPTSSRHERFSLRSTSRGRQGGESRRGSSPGARRDGRGHAAPGSAGFVRKLRHDVQAGGDAEVGGSAEGFVTSEADDTDGAVRPRRVGSASKAHLRVEAVAKFAAAKRNRRRRARVRQDGVGESGEMVLAGRAEGTSAEEARSSLGDAAGREAGTGAGGTAPGVGELPGGIRPPSQAEEDETEDEQTPTPALGAADVTIASGGVSSPSAPQLLADAAAEGSDWSDDCNPMRRPRAMVGDNSTLSSGAAPGPHRMSTSAGVDSTPQRSSTPDLASRCTSRGSASGTGLGLAPGATSRRGGTPGVGIRRGAASGIARRRMGTPNTGPGRPGQDRIQASALDERTDDVKAALARSGEISATFSLLAGPAVARVERAAQAQREKILRRARRSRSNSTPAEQTAARLLEIAAATSEAYFLKGSPFPIRSHGSHAPTGLSATAGGEPRPAARADVSVAPGSLVVPRMLAAKATPRVYTPRGTWKHQAPEMDSREAVAMAHVAIAHAASAAAAHAAAEVAAQGATLIPGWRTDDEASAGIRHASGRTWPEGAQSAGGRPWAGGGAGLNAPRGGGTRTPWQSSGTAMVVPPSSRMPMSPRA